MIAAGLCAMGGCFAMDATGAVQESYWPSEWVDITNNEIIALERTPFPGGDSQNDVLNCRFYLDLLTPPAKIVDDTIPYGYANAKVSSDTWINSGVYSTLYTNRIVFYYGMAKSTHSLFSGWVDVRSARDACMWTIGETEQVTLYATFSIGDELTRNRVLRTGQIRQFCYMSYVNNRTGMKWMISAMLSPLNAPALWINDSATLIEI